MELERVIKLSTMYDGSTHLVLTDEPKQESPAQGILSGVLTRDLPALNWPAEPKRGQDRKRHLPTGAGAGAQDAWDCPVLQATTRIHLSRRHPLGDRPVHLLDIEVSSREHPHALPHQRDAQCVRW